jgi:hypothetical protein
MLQLPLGYRYLIQLGGYVVFYCNLISLGLPVQSHLQEMIKALFMLWLGKAFTPEKSYFLASKATV